MPGLARSVAMDTRPLGQTGLSTRPLAFGGNVFGWTADKAVSFDLLDAFVDEGFDLIDTAEVYSAWVPGHQGGESETVIGEWLAARGRRDRVHIVTKVGMPMPGGRDGLSAGRIAEAVEGSLKRLRTDHIDLYLSHKDDPGAPLDETLEAFDRLVKAGKVRAVGASNYSAGRLQEANTAAVRGGLARYEVLQPEYNLLAREVEADLLPYCMAEGIGVITYFSLAAGFLTGKYRTPADVEGKARKGAVSKYLNARGFALLEAVDAVAAAHGVKPAQVALAWVMAKPGVTAAIASATSVEQLHELTAAARLTLAADEMRALDAAGASPSP